MFLHAVKMIHTSQVSIWHMQILSMNGRYRGTQINTSMSRVARVTPGEQFLVICRAAGFLMVAVTA